MSIVSTSSLPAEADRLVSVPLGRLVPHPANPNVIPDDVRQKVARHIAESGRYPPLIIRPHPEFPDLFQVIDGHKREEVLRQLGHTEALCYVWPCDDAEALMLLATLNRLHGEDVPAKRAELLQELTVLMPAEELALLLPEGASAIEQTIALIDLDADALLDELTAAADREADASPRVMTFAIDPADEPAVEAAIAAVVATLEGRNRRGRALVEICRARLAGDAG